MGDKVKEVKKALWILSDPMQTEMHIKGVLGMEIVKPLKDKGFPL